MSKIGAILPQLPTQHRFYNDNSTDFSKLDDGSVHLIVTSPPYWTLKRYVDSDKQLGHINDYEEFLEKLDKVWEMCYSA